MVIEQVAFYSNITSGFLLDSSEYSNTSNEAIKCWGNLTGPPPSKEGE